MMTGRPDPNSEPRSLHGLWHAIREARLEVDEAADRVEARTVHGIASANAVVQDADENLDERAPEPGSAGRADRDA
jgi:hypothetical protein